MLRHVVLLELRPDAPPGRAQAIAAALSALPGTVPGIVSYEVHVDLGLGDGNAQVGVVAGFVDEAAWRAYGPHPAHQAVVADLIRPVLLRRLALQAELEGAELEGAELVGAELVGGVGPGTGR